MHSPHCSVYHAVRMTVHVYCSTAQYTCTVILSSLVHYLQLCKFISRALSEIVTWRAVTYSVTNMTVTSVPICQWNVSMFYANAEQTKKGRGKKRAKLNNKS